MRCVRTLSGYVLVFLLGISSVVGAQIPASGADGYNRLISPTKADHMVMSGRGVMYVAHGSDIVCLYPDGEEVFVAHLEQPVSGLELDRQGTLLVSVALAGAVYAISPSRTKTVVASDLLVPGQLHVANNGRVFVSTQEGIVELIRTR